MDEPPLDPDTLGERLTEVFAVVGPLYRRVARTVEDAGTQDGVPIGIRAVLELLQAAGPATVPQIASTLVLSRQFIQRQVNEARDAGYVELRENPAHQRSSLVALTDQGAAAIAAVKAREHALLRQTGGDLTAAELDATLRVLREMLALFRDA